MKSALGVRCALCVSLLGLAGIAGGLLSPAGLLSEEADPAASEVVERDLTYDGSGDGPFGPGDGEPAVNFRLRSLAAAGDPDVGLLSVHLNDRHLYTIGLPRADAIAPLDDGLVLTITQKQAEIVLGRKLEDPDLPPVTVSCVLYSRLTMGLVDVVTWEGYLQGCWLEFPDLAPVADETGGESQPVLKPRVDISSTLGEPMPIDLRLQKDTIYYILFASEDREAILLHPENPEIYSRARVVSGGTLAWKPEDDAGGDGKANRKRLKFTPNSDRTYLVVWTLHRAADPAEGAGSDGADDAGDESAGVSGWTRSAVYELTNGVAEEEEDPNLAE